MSSVFIKIRDKGRTGSAWKPGAERGRGWGREAGERNDPNNVHTSKSMNNTKEINKNLYFKEKKEKK
jgi:hypothetical protein